MDKETCPNKEILVKLPSSFDRMDEAAWFIHLMEENYHNADKFRWSLNSFLRTLKEIMQVVTIEVQHDKELIKLTARKKVELSSDPLLSYLFKQRDLVVHKSMLKPVSKGYIGFTCGRGLKLGFGLPIDPLADSVEAILKYIFHVAKNEDFMGILYTQEDGSGEYTCVKREWKMSQFPDIEITQLAANAWEKVAQTFFDIATAKGAKLIKPTFKLGDPNVVHFEIYRPEWINQQLEFFKQKVENDET